MIYLIGGSPRCGKTKVAKALARKTHRPWFPADYLGAVIYQYMSDEERKIKFPLSAIRDENPSNDYRYTTYTAQEIVEFYYVQAESTWLGLEAFIKYAVHDGQDFILEGYQITPELLSQLDDDVINNIRPAFLYKSDIADIEAGIKKNTDPADWLIKNTEDEGTYSKVAQMMKIFGERTRLDAERYHVSVFNIDGNFDKKVEEVVSYLTK